MSMTKQITFRPINNDDLDFLQRVYFSTREEEMKIVPWTDDQKQAFLHQQFDAQHTYYQEQFKDAKFEVILRDDQPIGRLYLDRRENEHRIIDIAILPEFRGQGIGGGIMRDLLDEAIQVNKPVTIHVERNNQAMHLYERLGFQMIEDQGVYFLMKWIPESQ